MVIDGWMPRPNNGAAADNGTFCLEALRFGSTLSGPFFNLCRASLRLAPNDCAPGHASGSRHSELC